MTFLAVLLRILVNPLSNVFQKRICARGQSAVFANFLTYLLLSVVVFPWAVQIPWTTFPASFWAYAALVGLFGGLGNGFLVQAVRSGELSVLGPINAYKSVVGILFGIFLLGEVPGVLGCFGVLLIVGGSYYVLDALPERFSWKLLGRGEFRYRIAAMVLAAIEAVFIKKVILASDPNVAFFAWCWGGAAFSLLFLPLQEKDSGKKFWKTQTSLAFSQVLPYGGLVLCVGLMQFATNYAFDRMPVGYALALFQLSSLLSVVYGYCFFGETSIGRKLFGAAIMMLGSVLIILQKG